MEPHKEMGDNKAKGENTPSLNVNELSNKLKEAQQKTEEFKDLAQRIQAEFENFAKRTNKEKMEFKKIASLEVINDFLPVLDSFDGAIEAMKKKGDTEHVNGLVLLQKQLWSVLQKHGLQKIEALGKKFDHNLHDVFLSESDEKKEDYIVTQEIQKGYLLNSLVLRPSKVKINKLHEKMKTIDGLEG